MLDFEIIALSAEMEMMDKKTTEVLGITFRDLINNAAQAFCNSLTNDVIIQDVEHILILCGNGNNGADGYALALLLNERGFDVSVYTVDPNKARSKNAQFIFEKCFSNKKIKFEYDIDFALTRTDMIIDCVYGTGFRDCFIPQVETVFQKVALCSAKKVALDTPSGIITDTGEACNYAFKADLTITFEFLKYCLVAASSRIYAGRVEIVSVGFPEEVRNKLLEKGRRYIVNDPLSKIVRKPDGNKGDFGKLLMVCGSRTMTGAGYFSAMGALRTGIGLVYFSCPENIMPVMQTKLNEPVFLPYEQYNIDSFIESIGSLNKYTAVVHGCGVGQHEITSKINEYLLLNSEQPCIFDADAINALVGNLDLLLEKKCKLILTPHPAEMARLIGKDVEFVQNNRLDVARDFANAYDCAVILKGARTKIALPRGKVYINPTVNSGMAKGGSGDILSGMVASLVAQKHPIAKALASAVFRHGESGDRAREVLGESAMLPTDMLNYIR